MLEQYASQKQFIKQNALAIAILIFSTVFALWQHSTGYSWDFSAYAVNARADGAVFEWTRPPLASAIMFVLGGSLLDIPYFMVFFMSSAYTLSYFVYKKNIDLDSLRKKRSVLLFASAVVFYLVSLYSYKLYRLPLIGVSLVFLFPLLMMRTKDFYGKLKGGIVFVILIFVFFNLLLLLSPVEPFRSANMYLASLF